MADTPAATPATAGNSWAGLMPFIQMAFGQAPGQPQNNYMQQIGTQAAQHPSNLPRHPLAPTPVNLAGMGAGPFAQGAVPGPQMQMPPQISSPAMPSAYAPQQMPQMPSFTNPAATSPMVGLPSLKTSAPMTADHFTTGAPNPFGNR